MSLIVGFVSFILFLLFQAQHIPAGDSGDLVTAAATFGVPHPPGYPLYTFFAWLMSHIPVSTIAWRVGLLSSLPHAIVLMIVFAIVLRLTRSKISSLFASLVLMGNYLFFLYSVTPEVFALLDFFVVLLIWLALRWHQTKNVRVFYSICFVVGLSLTHHHVILSFFPGLAYLFFMNRRYFLGRISWFRAIGIFGVGMLPYLYVPIAARGNSIINWDRVTTPVNFIHLITRADYGTFRSAALIGSLPIHRLLEIKAYAQYILMDFTWIGVILIGIGLFRLWKTKRELFWFFIILAASLGPVFLFYASFPLSFRFTLGTFERFILPSYIVLVIIIGIGFSYLVTLVKDFAMRHFVMKERFAVLFVCVMFLYPLIWGATTIWKFTGYASDRTAENLAIDILTNLPRGSVFLTDRDTTLFATQYVRYVLKVRPDVIVLHGSRLSDKDYRTTVAKIYPSLVLPKANDAASFTEFLKKIGGSGLLFSGADYPVSENWYWVPHGIVLQLFPKEKLPDPFAMRDNNVRIWKSVHTPASGILAHYNHLMLSDVRDIYTSAELSFAKTLLRAGDYSHANAAIKQSISFGGDTQLADAYMYLGISEATLKNCQNALDDFTKSASLNIKPNDDIILYKALTMRDCVGDAKKAKELLDEYDALQQKNQTPLRQL